MSDLDDKLKEILHEYVSGIAFDIGPEDRNDLPTVKDLKQAFADDGYVRIMKANNRTIVMNGKDALGYIVYYSEETST